MASNKFCPALVDRKPMLLPTHDFLAQIVAPKWYLAGFKFIDQRLCAYLIFQLKRRGPHLKEGTYHSPVLIQL